jgi:hypothetical protein
MIHLFYEQYHHPFYGESIKLHVHQVDMNEILSTQRPISAKEDNLPALASVVAEFIISSTA